MSFNWRRAEPEVLVLKGLVYGIPEGKLDEAFRVASDLVEERGIRVVVWDGDKYNPAGSFTRILPMLASAHPSLQFVYFKRQGSAGGLIDGVGSVGQDKFGNELGPFPFLNSGNTTIVQATDPLPTSFCHLGVECGDVHWSELGLKGLKWVKANLAASVSYLAVGVGGTVAKELEMVAEAPADYPEGVSREEATLIEICR